MQNKRLLLAVLGCLLLIRFVIVPLWGWQNDAIAELKALTKQQAKVNALLKNESLLRDTIAEVHSDKVKFLQNVQQTKDQPSLSLNLQKTWQKVAKTNSVEVDLFNWVAHKLEVEPDIYSAKITARFVGRYPNIGKTLLTVEEFPGVYISEIRFDWRNNFSSTASVTAEVEFFVVYQEDKS